MAGNSSFYPKYYTASTRTMLKTFERFFFGGGVGGESLTPEKRRIFSGTCLLKWTKELVPPHSSRGGRGKRSSALRIRPGTLSQDHEEETGSKLVNRMTLGGNRGGMHSSKYLHKCLHHKIHPGKQHCKGTHTKRNIRISAFPHADTPTPALAKLVWSTGSETQEPRRSFHIG